MIVTRENFSKVIEELKTHRLFALDTETTGLKPYQGDRIFSLILTASKNDSRDPASELRSFYFNFWQYPDTAPVLDKAPTLAALKPLFGEPEALWYMHNAKFDMAVLWQEGVEISGTIHCTRSGARIERSDHFKYDLHSCAERIHLAKDDRVAAYIDEHHLWEWEYRNGKKTDKKKVYFYRVPFEIISEYGCTDAEVCFRLGCHQEHEIEAFSQHIRHHFPSRPLLSGVLQNERELTKTVFQIERVGVRIDRGYCERALAFERSRMQKGIESYRRETGLEYKASNPDFQKVFQEEKEKWVWGEPTKTGKVNPSFESDVLKYFKHPAARIILDIRDTKSKQDFYSGFLHYADENDVIHPNFNPDGARTGRFSSSDPNLQNLTSEEDEEELKQEFVVRRAIIPFEGFSLYGRDYSSQEYRLMYDTACVLYGKITPLVQAILDGVDPHQATADAVTRAGRMTLTRKKAKNGNFALLFGAGNAKLAKTIGGTIEDAKVVRRAILDASPEVAQLIQYASTVSERVGYIRNWFGRRIFIPSALSYKAVNALVQGGCADVTKIALNRIAARLQGKKSRLALTIHDEIILHMANEESGEIPGIVKECMESVYPGKYLCLTSAGYISRRNLADLEEHA